MKTTYDGKRYDSSRCEVIAERDHYNNGNYSGSTKLVRATDGMCLLLTIGNGQDIYIQDSFYVCDDVQWDLESMEMTEEQEKRAVELGLIKLV